MVKNVLFQLHWIFGITAGLILAVVGFTGAMLSFEDPILEAMNPGVMTVSVPADAEKLSPQALIEAVTAAHPALKVNSVTINSEPHLTSQIALAPAGGGSRGETRYVDPYTGALLGKPQGQDFFRSVMQLHRWILLPGGSTGAGRVIVGICTLILIYLAVTGLYLRWPKRHSLRTWFRIDLKKGGRPMWWSVHSVLGTFVFIAYLIMSVTGLWWSFEWWKNGMSVALTGKPVVAAQQQGGTPAAMAAASAAHGARVANRSSSRWRQRGLASRRRLMASSLRRPSRCRARQKIPCRSASCRTTLSMIAPPIRCGSTRPLATSSATTGSRQSRWVSRSTQATTTCTPGRTSASSASSSGCSPAC